MRDWVLDWQHPENVLRHTRIRQLLGNSAEHTAEPARLPLRIAHVLGLVLFALLGTVTALLVVLHRYPVVWLFDARGDFNVFYGAARAALHGREVYAVHN